MADVNRETTVEITAASNNYVEFSYAFVETTYSFTGTTQVVPETKEVAET